MTKFSCIHSEKQRRTVSGGSFRGHRDPENNLFTFKLFGVGYMLLRATVCSHSSSPSLATHHMWYRLRPEPYSCLPRQKRQQESSKPVARAIMHRKKNTYLICIQLQIAIRCRGGLYVIKLVKSGKYSPRSASEMQE